MEVVGDVEGVGGVVGESAAGIEGWNPRSRSWNHPVGRGGWWGGGVSSWEGIGMVGP